MKKFTLYLSVVHTALQLILALGIHYLLQHFFANLQFDSYFIIPIFFYLMGLFLIFRFQFALSEKPKMAVNKYLLVSVVKIFISFITILIYWIFDKEHIRNFTILFAVFYLINLIWETFIYIKMELFLKHKGDPQISTKKSY